MVVNDELIAAYIDGNVTVEERNEVRKYLAKHPIEQDLVISLQDNVNILDEGYQEPNYRNIGINKNQSYSKIAYAAAAFAPKFNLPTSEKVAENPISKRLNRMASFIEEVCNDEIK